MMVIIMIIMAESALLHSQSPCPGRCMIYSRLRQLPTGTAEQRMLAQYCTVHSNIRYFSTT